MTQCTLQTSQIKADQIMLRCKESCVISSDAYASEQNTLHSKESVQ